MSLHLQWLIILHLLSIFLEIFLDILPYVSSSIGFWKAYLILARFGLVALQLSEFIHWFIKYRVFDPEPIFDPGTISFNEPELNVESIQNDSEPDC